MVSAYSERKLVQESEWMRVYRVDARTQMHESKFLTDHLAVSADSIRRRWPGFSDEEKLEFSQAFQVKPEVTSEDESVLDFLMEVGNLPIWITIAPLLPRHSARDRVLRFLLDRVTEEGNMKANFYQSIGQLRDRRALPALRAMYEGYERKLRDQIESAGEFEYQDYLSCCKALWAIEGLVIYREAIERFAKSENDRVRFWAVALLRNE